MCYIMYTHFGACLHVKVWVCSFFGAHVETKDGLRLVLTSPLRQGPLFAAAYGRITGVQPSEGSPASHTTAGVLESQLHAVSLRVLWALKS